MASRSTVLTAIIAAAGTATAFVLNPTADQHREHIKEAIAERSPLAGAFGVGALKAYSSEYHSLGVASYTTMNEHTLSVGAFGIVFVLQPSGNA